VIQMNKSHSIDTSIYNARYKRNQLN